MSGKVYWASGLAIFALFVGCVEIDNASSSSTDSTPDFNPTRVVPSFPAITNAPVIPASEVSDQVTDKELVLGVVVNGEARAYPINMLTGPNREIINDTLGNRAIAATW